MTSQRAKSAGLRPSERSKVSVAAIKKAVTVESARADEEDVWSDARDSEARGSGETQEEEKDGKDE